MSDVEKGWRLASSLSAFWQGGEVGMIIILKAGATKRVKDEVTKRVKELVHAPRDPRNDEACHRRRR